MKTDFFLPVILQILGVGIIIAEFVLPSGGLLTLTALTAFAYSLFHVFHDISPGVGMYFLAADIILIPMAVVIGMKLIANSPVTLRKTLAREDGAISQDPEWGVLTGKTGKAMTDLRPAGKAIIDDIRLDVVSTGDYIKKDSPVVVSAVSGNRIVVKAADR